MNVSILRISISLSSSHQMLFKHAIFFATANRRDVLTRILRVFAGSHVNTPHMCRMTCIHASVSRESEGTRFGGPGQKALQSMN